MPPPTHFQEMVEFLNGLVRLAWTTELSVPGRLAADASALGYFGEGASFIASLPVDPSDKMGEVKPHEQLSVRGIQESRSRAHRSGKRKKPLNCELCPYTTPYSSHFVDHMRMHSGEKPFKCSNCNAAFATRTNCRCHFVKHCSKRPR